VGGREDSWRVTLDKEKIVTSRNSIAHAHLVPSCLGIQIAMMKQKDVGVFCHIRDF